MEPNQVDWHSVAHEIWAVAQLGPTEGILDGVDRITAVITAALSAMPDSYDRGWNAAIEAAAKACESETDYTMVTPNVNRIKLSQAITALKKPTGNLAPADQKINARTY